MNNKKKVIAREQFLYDLTEKILLFMEDNDITRSDLARKLGKNRQHISRSLSGRNITIATLVDICTALDIKPVFSIDFCDEDSE